MRWSEHAAAQSRMTEPVAWIFRIDGACWHELKRASIPLGNRELLECRQWLRRVRGAKVDRGVTDGR
jgi:hypothetical protein